MAATAALPPTLLPAAARFALIMDGLRAAVAGRIGYYAVTGPMIIYICNRLSRINRTFQALAALILAGKLPAGRVHRPRAGDETAPVSPRDPEAAVRRDFFPIWRWVPTYRFAWLCLVAPNWAGPRYASVYGAALRELLGDAEMAALLAATPRMAKLLRPLCWALGIEASVLRPRPAPSPPAVDEQAIGSVEPAGGGTVSRAAMTATAANAESSAATRLDRGFWAGRFSPE